MSMLNDVPHDLASLAADDLSQSLRSEIIESQKSQADFLKWKLIAVAGVSSVAFGFTANPPATAVDGTKLLLCLVPLICAYVDLISLHLMIRMITIGAYLKLAGNAYERFVFKVRELSRANPFIFEAIALHGSSLVFNIVILVLGFVLRFVAGWPEYITWSYIVAGGLGGGATLFSWLVYHMRVREVTAEAERAFAASEATTLAQ